MWPREWVEIYLYSSITAELEGGEWSAARPGRTLPPGKDRIPILQEAGWALVPVWTGVKSRPHRDSIPDRPARSESLYRLSYPAHILRKVLMKNNRFNVGTNDINTMNSSNRIAATLYSRDIVCLRNMSINTLRKGDDYYYYYYCYYY